MQSVASVVETHELGLGSDICSLFSFFGVEMSVNRFLCRGFIAAILLAPLMGCQPEATAVSDGLEEDDIVAYEKMLAGDEADTDSQEAER